MPKAKAKGKAEDEGEGEGEGQGEGEGEGDMDVRIAITCYIAYRLPIDCLLIALDANMFSHNGYGPGTLDPGPKAAVPQVPAQQLLGPGPGFRVISIMAEHMCIKSNQWAINKQYTTGNLPHSMSYL